MAGGDQLPELAVAPPATVLDRRASVSPASASGRHAPVWESSRIRDWSSCPNLLSPLLSTSDVEVLRRSAEPTQLGDRVHGHADCGDCLDLGDDYPVAYNRCHRLRALSSPHLSSFDELLLGLWFPGTAHVLRREVRHGCGRIRSVSPARGGPLPEPHESQVRLAQSPRRLMVSSASRWAFTDWSWVVFTTTATLSR